MNLLKFYKVVICINQYNGQILENVDEDAVTQYNAWLNKP